MPAIKPYPMQIVRVRSSNTVAHPIAANSPTNHATGAECCSGLCRIAGEVVLSRQAPGR
jgi:hypothetical protein